jgi:hypothetical protein
LARPAAIVLAAGMGACAPRSLPTAQGSAGFFKDVTRAANISFAHESGLEKALHPNLLQTTGSGCAMLDYDGDGHLDLYLVDSAHNPNGGNRLYRNRGDGTFEDRTDAAGARGHGFGMGCAVGDYDRDNDPDLYLTNYGENQLYRNNGDGTFTDVTASAGARGGGWSTTAAFIDVDGDLDLDLYVGRYVRFNAKSKQLCETAGVIGGCNPSDYRSEPDVLYINRGDGTFRDGTRAAGIRDENGRALGVLIDDYDQDGRPDLFVANDGSACFLFHNLGGGRFKEVAIGAGVAYSVGGRALASMGCDWGDYDDDGKPDLVVGSFLGEPSGLYRAVGKGLFVSSVASAGIADATTRVLTFGLGFFDFDRDGDLDLVHANGHVHPQIETVDPDAPYTQPRQLFENVGGGRFEEIGAKAGADFTRKTVGRGLAFGDIDNDGDIDLLQSNNGLPAELLRNDFKSDNHWLGIRLTHPKGEAVVLNSRITVSAGNRKWVRYQRTAYSYAGSNDPRVLFGLGKTAGPVTIEVRWADGSHTHVDGVPADGYVNLTPAGLQP